MQKWLLTIYGDDGLATAHIVFSAGGSGEATRLACQIAEQLQFREGEAVSDWSLLNMSPHTGLTDDPSRLIVTDQHREAPPGSFLDGPIGGQN